MGKAQQSKLCHRCGIVPVHHSCQQRPQSKMRGETKGLTTGPQWTANDWAAHLRGKVETGARPDVRPGDVWTLFGKNYTIDRIDNGTAWYRPNERGGGGFKLSAFTTATLVSRAQKVERAKGDLRVGDVCRINDMKASDCGWDKARLRLAGRVSTHGRVLWTCELMHDVNGSWKRGETTPVEAHRLELVEG